MAKDGLPEILFVGRKRKERYKLTVFQIIEKDPDGVPRLCRLLKDDESVSLKGGEEFLTVYIPEHMLKGEST